MFFNKKDECEVHVLKSNLDSLFFFQDRIMVNSYNHYYYLIQDSRAFFLLGKPNCPPHNLILKITMRWKELQYILNL